MGHSSMQLRTPAVAARQGLGLYPILFVLFLAGSCYGSRSELTELAIYVLPFSLLGLAACRLFVTGRVALHDPEWRPLLGTVIALGSLMGNLVASDLSGAAYSLLFLGTWMSACVLSDAIDTDRLIRALAFAGAAFALLCLVLTYKELVGAFMHANRTLDVKERYSGPFKANPNLLGHMAGCFAVLTFWQAFAEKWKLRAIFLAAMALLLVICLAASSRGGCFAAVAAIGVVFAYRAVRSANQSVLPRLVAVTLVVTAALVIFFPGVLGTLSHLLDLDSRYRGVNSEFSGRFERWNAVLAQFGTEHIPYIWGTGLRAAWLSYLIDVIDNGYIVLAAEVGVIGLLCWLGRVLAVALAALRRTAKPAPPVSAYLMMSLVIFFLAESMVARYLLAIGNSGSVLFLLLVITYRTKAPDEPRTRAVLAR
jgi:O-antigen ligase